MRITNAFLDSSHQGSSPIALRPLKSLSNYPIKIDLLVYFSHLFPVTLFNSSTDSTLAWVSVVNFHSFNLSTNFASLISNFANLGYNSFKVNSCKDSAQVRTVVILKFTLVKMSFSFP